MFAKLLALYIVSQLSKSISFDKICPLIKIANLIILLSFLKYGHKAFRNLVLFITSNLKYNKISL